MANLAALLAGMLLHRLALEETGDPALARRAAWFIALFPGAFVLVWGYAEALMLVALIGAFLALRRQAWWVAGALGLAARTGPAHRPVPGPARPLGGDSRLAGRNWAGTAWPGRRPSSGHRSGS